MGLAKSLSVALVGVSAHVVEVEADVSTGLPGFTLTALSDRVLKHVEHRVKSAVNNSGESWPSRRTTVALAPATIPNSGSRLDLPIAVTVLAAAGALPRAGLERTVLLGELSLDGRVRGVTGVLPAVAGAARAGCRRFVVPRANAREARLVPDVEVFAVENLVELCSWLRDELPDAALLAEWDDEPVAPVTDVADLADVVGQELGRQAIEVAAAGAHHVLLSGPPGVGKTMLAERLPGILPELDREQALEVTGIHSVAGRLAPGSPLVTAAPFCAPHHSATLAAVVGGGTGIAAPGAVSLAHRGVLFLDEAPEFHPRVLDALRQPVESGSVTLARAGGVVTYPARFLLVLAANPCPCSAGGRDITTHPCICSAPVRLRYHSRLSGPLRDRIDLVVSLDPVSRMVLTEGVQGESSAAVRARVEAARDRARHRYRDTPWTTTGEVPGPTLRRSWPVAEPAAAVLRKAVAARQLSTRGIDRVLKVAWTLADLAGRGTPEAADVEAAIALRTGQGLPQLLVRSA